MSTKALNLTTTNLKHIKGVGRLRFGIIVAEWNETITTTLANGAENALLEAGVLQSNIYKLDVPGSFELPLGARLAYDNLKLDAIICIGVLIKGDTPHFEYISESVAHGLMTLNLELKIPVIFGVLTTLTEQQALDRSGGSHGNKGEEAAISALKMILLKQQLV